VSRTAASRAPTRRPPDGPSGTRITGGRAHPIPMSSRAEHMGGLGDGLIASSPHRTRRDHTVPPAREQGRGKPPGRPAARGPHPRLGSPRPWGLRTHRPQPMGAGPSPRGQPRGEHPPQHPRSGWGGNRRPTQAESRRRPRRQVPILGPFGTEAASWWPSVMAALAPPRLPLPNPGVAGCYPNGPQSRSEAV